jgi:hypothetical protein
VPLLTQSSRGKRKRREKKTPKSVKRKNRRKLITVEEVHYIHFNNDTHCFIKTLPVGGKCRVKDNELPEIFTVKGLEVIKL